MTILLVCYEYNHECVLAICLFGWIPSLVEFLGAEDPHVCSLKARHLCNVVLPKSEIYQLAKFHPINISQLTNISTINIWLVVWNMAFIFPNSWDDDPIWRTHIFQRGRYTTNQISLPISDPWVPTPRYGVVSTSQVTDEEMRDDLNRWLRLSANHRQSLDRLQWVDE